MNDDRTIPWFLIDPSKTFLFNSHRFFNKTLFISCFFLASIVLPWVKFIGFTFVSIDTGLPLGFEKYYDVGQCFMATWYISSSYPQTRHSETKPIYLLNSLPKELSRQKLYTPQCTPPTRIGVYTMAVIFFHFLPSALVLFNREYTRWYNEFHRRRKKK